MIRRSRTVAMAAATACVMGMLCTPTAATAAGTTTHAADYNTASESPAGVANLTPEALAAITHPESREDLRTLMDLAEVPAGTRVKLDSALARLSDAQVASMLTAGSRTGAGAHLRGLVAAAIDPANYQCDRTPLDEYVSSLLSEASLPGLVGLQLMLALGLLDIQTYEGLLYAHARPNTYGDDDEYAQPLTKALRQAQDFWDVDTDDVILGAMDAALWQRIDGDSAEARAARLRAATAWATWGRTVRGPIDVDGTPIDVNLGMQMLAGFEELLKQPHQSFLKQGRSDLFTLNAFAFTTEDDPYAQSDPDLRTVSDRIIFGPGILHASQALGFGQMGPRGILAHEFMHHVQYENDVEFAAPDPLDQPEATRRTELMADAGASYFATHKRGLTLNAQRMAEVATSFYAVGDCSFDSDGHHGTPDQRRRASYWGRDLAAQEQVQGHILPSATVITRFDAALPALVAPDAQ